MSLVPMGTVYGTLLNFRSELDALGGQLHQPPYNAPPKAPVLYIKPANTWSADGSDIPVPAGVAEVEVGATVAAVMRAPGELAGFLLMNDLQLPHASLFRPPVRFKCLDGFLGVGGTLLPPEQAGDLSNLVIEVRINGELRHLVKFNALVRSPQKLIEDVAEFMTLDKGDALMMGCGTRRPLVRAGDSIELSAPGMGKLTNRLVAEAAP
jgi:5-oxopent-3-ene-1,2,5-tricarboxylate decarboxylase/2-hydroxyhepta-2,4-diene-1,7-dioate isomerase